MVKECIEEKVLYPMPPKNPLKTSFSLGSTVAKCVHLPEVPVALFLNMLLVGWYEPFLLVLTPEGAGFLRGTPISPNGRLQSLRKLGGSKLS